MVLINLAIKLLFHFFNGVVVPKICKTIFEKNLIWLLRMYTFTFRLATYQNKADEQYRWNPIVETYQLDRVDEWYLNSDEVREELFTYR